MQKLLLTACIIGCAFSTVYSQNMVFDWARMYEAVGGENEIYQQFFQADSHHLFTVGRVLSANNDLDPDTGTYQLPAPFNRNYHISMFDLDGNHIWSKILGSTQGTTGSFNTEIRDMALSSDGNLYVTGSFLDTLYYETASGWQYITSQGLTDIFFGKMDALGNWDWMRSYGGIYDDESGALEITHSGEIYLSGFYADSVSFLPNMPPYYAPVYELFMLQFNALGQEQWLYSTSNPGSYPRFEIHCMALDKQDGIYIGGDYLDYYGDSVNFQSAGNMALVGNDIDYDGFLLKLDTSGNFKWVRFYSTSVNDHVDRIAFNANNSIVVSGRAGNSSLDFAPGTTADSLNFSSGLIGNYLLCLSQDGQFRWLKQLFADNGGLTDLIMHIVTDGQGNIHGLSTFDAPLDADPGSDTVIYTKNPGGASFSAYSLKLDSLGNYLWSHHYTTSYNGEHAYGIGKDPFDNIYVGLFDGVGLNPDTLTLGNIALVHSVAARHFLKLRACGAPSVAQPNDSTLVGVYQNVSYQWLDCNDGYAIVDGATERTFTPTISGSYALETTSYGCVADTSACYQLNRDHSDGISNNDLSSSVSVFPNPAFGKITVNLPETTEQVVCRISNVLGQTVYRQYFKRVSHFQVELPKAVGIYFIELDLDKGQRVVKKVIKE